MGFLVADLSVALLYDVAADGKSQTCSRTLGGEVWSKQLVEVLLLHSVSVVFYNYIIVTVPCALPQTDEYTAFFSPILCCLLVLHLHCLHSVGDQVHEDADQLRLRSHHKCLLHTDVRDLHILPVVKYEQLVLEDEVKVDQDRILAVKLGKSRELVGCLCQDVDVLEDDL